MCQECDTHEKEVLNKLDENREEIRIKADCSNSVDELITVAKENGIILSFERAQRIFEKMRAKNAELSDDDLDLVVAAAGKAIGSPIIQNMRQKRY